MTHALSLVLLMLLSQSRELACTDNYVFPALWHFHHPVQDASGHKQHANAIFANIMSD